MQPKNDAERTAAKKAKTLTRAEAKAAKLRAELDATEKTIEHIKADKEKSDGLDEAASFAAMLRSEQQAYLRAKRKDFGLPRLIDQAKAEKQPPEFVAFMVLYAAWIKSKRPVEGVAVEWEVLMKKMGLQKRQVKEYVQRLIGRGHLVKLSGGKGRAQRLMVGPAGYPIDIDDWGNYKFLPGSE